MTRGRQRRAPHAGEEGMTSEDERRAQARQRGRDYINSKAGAVTAEALGALLEAREKEQDAGSDEVRAAAQTAFVAGWAAFSRATGATDVGRRRMAVEALDYPSGRPVDAGDFNRVLTDCFFTLETQAGRDKLRRLLSRHFLDNEETLTPSARLLVDKLFKNPTGLLGALDRVEKKSGVDARRGLDDSVRTVVVSAAGYSAGVEFGLDGNIPFAFWKRAQRRHSRETRTDWRAHMGVQDQATAEGGDDQGLVPSGRPARQEVQAGARRRFRQSETTPRSRSRGIDYRRPWFESENFTSGQL